MKKTSRILALVCALLLMLSVLAGCGKSETPQTANDTPAQDKTSEPAETTA